MKRLTILAFCLSLAAHGEVIDATAKVTAAMLYLNSADITREATVSIPQAGEWTVRLKNVRPDDVKVEGATLLSQAQEIPTEDAPPTELAQELEKAQIHLEQIQSAFHRSAELGKALRKRLETQPDNYESVAELFPKLQQQYNDLIEQKAAAEKEIARLKQAVDKEKRDEITLITLQANQAGTAKITLKQNQFTGANWRPSSEINLDTDTGKIHLTAYATIYQQSEENWDNADITLAITPPTSRTLPVATPQVFSAVKPTADIASAPVASAPVESMALKETTFMGTLEYQAMRAKRAPEPEILTNGIDFTVKLPQQTNIKHHQQVRLSYYHNTVETKDLYSGIYQWSAPEALLVAKWQQPDVAFLAGEAQIMRDGLTVDRRNFYDIIAAASELTFSFGIDPSFEVKKDTAPQYTDRKGVISKDKQEQIRETFTVKNLSGTKRPVKFFAILPTAGNANVTITSEWSSKPDEQNVDGIKGQMLWNVGTIAKDKPWTFNFGYNVKYPEDMVLQ